MNLLAVCETYWVGLLSRLTDRGFLGVLQSRVAESLCFGWLLLPGNVKTTINIKGNHEIIKMISLCALCNGRTNLYYKEFFLLLSIYVYM